MAANDIRKSGSIGIAAGLIDQFTERVGQRLASEATAAAANAHNQR
jgi:hypothetical protein